MSGDRLPRCALFAATVLAMLLSSARRAASADAVERPNVIVILADDLGYGDLACYGHRRFKTPHLDRLAAQGVRLTQFNTPMAYCAPTRAALLTGRYPLRCGMTANPTPDATPAADALGLPLDEVLLPQLLRQAGYATGMIGKWHLGHKRPELLPTRRGFESYLGIPYSNDMRPVHLLSGEAVVEYPVVQATLTDRYTSAAIEFIERNRERPFFLYLAHAMPHKPLAVSEKFYKRSGAGLYGDTIAQLDESVGRLLATLAELKLDERTLVLFTSDNGPWYGGSTGGLRGMKSSTWEGGYRVPLIARWPGKIPAGGVSAELAVTMDVFATVLAAANVPSPAERTIDGQNLLPVFTGGAKSRHEVIFGQAADKLAVVRDARWKLHVLPPRGPASLKPGAKWVDARGPDGVTILAPHEQAHPSEFPGLETGDAPKAMMLFDLDADPGEQRDVAAEHPEVVARLKERYDRMNEEVRAK
jgi:uncharacterized sulfatase